MAAIPADIAATAKQLTLDLCGFDDVFYDDNSIAQAILAERERRLSKTHVIQHMDETALVGLVMTLTGGAANPDVVRGQIKRVRQSNVEVG